jgi:hypothetical protein
MTLLGEDNPWIARGIAFGVVLLLLGNKWSANTNTRFDTRCISSVMKIQIAVKCHCYLTQKQHTTVIQPAGAKTTQGNLTNSWDLRYKLLRVEAV